MSNLKNVIEEVKEGRKGAWIFDESGVIKDDVFVGDTIDILENWLLNGEEEELPDYTDDELYDIISDNTYNWGSNISNDIAFGFDKKRGLMIAHIHIGGDVRCNYSDYFALNIGSMEELFESVDEFHKDIDDTHCAFFNMFSEAIEVYNTETDESITCYEIELKDLLEEIKEKESKEC